ncbi:hypothetical protein KKG41_00715 [Patescibacteria group bacterium]|nr:hypothetical protein [Patescibacteria group bacterium]MBU1891031.1 hypothetical protein [Patescibacteria group bacterium]
MSFENPIPESEQQVGFGSRPSELDRPLEALTREEKEALWQKTAEAVDRVVDPENEPVDKGIKETVIALNALNINTSGSCEGHTDHGTGMPFVHIEASGEPEEQYKGETAAIQKIADERGLDFDVVKRGIDGQAKEDAFDIYSENGQTDDYKKWCEENRALRQQVTGVLEEYNRDRDVAPDVRLMIVNYGDDSFRINNGGVHEKPVNEKPDEEQKQELIRRLESDQAEMKTFTEFLKKKYFGE